MKLSFEGVGQWCATFAGNDLQEGVLVKPVGNGRMGVCTAGDDVCGRVKAPGRDGRACSVQLGGAVTTAYSGTAPGLGWAALVADGDGGVTTLVSGRSHLVLDVDAADKAVTFIL